jgi:hypothetical protein
MGFSKDRRTVGRRWGRAPVRIEAVPTTITLPSRLRTCHTLKPDGTRGAKAPLALAAGRSVHFKTSAAHGTMWYLLTGE